MKHLNTFSFIAAAALLASCGGQEGKSLVLYYSQTGVTKAVAEQIQNLTGADICTIEIEEPYDGDYGATIARVLGEREAGTLPTLKPLGVDLKKYDKIYLGYPIWFGTCAPPVLALIAQEDFAGKTIVPFCTFGSGGIEASSRDLAEALPQATICQGYGVRTIRSAAMPAEVERFLKENGHIEGEVEALPEFSAQETVGETETAIFTAACGDYQFPLGTPVSFGKRQIGNAEEYEFLVDNQTTIYVTVSEDGKCEFTRVVR